MAGLDATRTWTEIIDNTGLPPEQYPEGGTLPFRPELIGSAHFFARLRPRLDITIRGTYVAPQVVLTERFSGRRATLDGYFRLDGTVNYRALDRTTVYLRATNLLDTEYETAFDRPGVPLRAALGVSVEP